MPLAIAPALVLAVVATAVGAGIVAVDHLARASPRHREPRPAARGRAPGVHDAARGGARSWRRTATRDVVWQVESGDVNGPKGASRSVQSVNAAGPRLRDPGCRPRRRPAPHGRRPARGRDAASAPATGCRCRDDARGPERARGRRGASPGPPSGCPRTIPTRSRPPSARITPTWSGASSSCSATRTTPRTSPRRPTCGHSARGTGSPAATSGPGSTRSPCASRSTSSAATGAGLPRSSASSRGRGATRRTPTCGPPSAALDPRTRTALLLNVVDGYTQREIGTILGVPEGTVASWLSRGRATLRRELDPGR